MIALCMLNKPATCISQVWSSSKTEMIYRALQLHCCPHLGSHSFFYAVLLIDTKRVIAGG